MRIRTLTVALAVLCSLCIAEETRTTTQTIATLVQQLGDEDFDVRNDAAQKLSELGDPAIPELKRVYDACDNVEVKSRLESLIWPVYAVVASAEIHRGSANQKPITLDGRPSIQRNNNARDLKFSWKQTRGPKVDIQYNERQKIATVAAQACTPGEYRFELVVTQGSKQSRPAVVTVIIEKAATISLPETVDASFSRGVISEEVLRRIIEEDRWLKEQGLMPPDDPVH